MTVLTLIKDCRLFFGLMEFLSIFDIVDEDKEKGCFLSFNLPFGFLT